MFSPDHHDPLYMLNVLLILSRSLMNLSAERNWWSGDEAWGAVDLLVHPKGVQLVRGKGSVQDTQVLPLQTQRPMPSWTLLCLQKHCHARTCSSLLVPVKENLKVAVYMERKFAFRNFVGSSVLSFLGNYYKFFVELHHRGFLSEQMPGSKSGLWLWVHKNNLPNK